MNATVLAWNRLSKGIFPRVGQKCLVRQDNDYKPVFSAIYMGSGHFIDLEDKNSWDDFEKDYGCGFYGEIVDWIPLELVKI